MKASYSLNSYDRDGDVVDEGIFIHLTKSDHGCNCCTILQLQNIAELKELKESLERIILELEDGRIDSIPNSEILIDNTKRKGFCNV